MSTSRKEHPTVAAHRQRPIPDKVSQLLDAAWLRQLCLDAGADDVGFVDVDRSVLAGERPHIQRAFPHTRSLMSLVLRMNRDNVRSPARSVANSEFHHTGDEINDVARRIEPHEGLRYGEDTTECQHGCAHSTHQLLAGIEAGRNRYAGFFGLGCDCFAF